MIDQTDEISWGYLIDPCFQLVNTKGVPLTGGYLEVYIHGTRNKYYCASDFDGTLQPFQIPLDSLGSNIVLAEIGQSYDVYVYNRFGSLVMSRYNVAPGKGGGGSNVSITSSDGTVDINSEGSVYDLSVQDIYDAVDDLRVDLDNLASGLVPVYFRGQGGGYTEINFDPSGSGEPVTTSFVSFNKKDGNLDLGYHSSLPLPEGMWAWSATLKFTSLDDVNVTMPYNITVKNSAQDPDFVHPYSGDLDLTYDSVQSVDLTGLVRGEGDFQIFVSLGPAYDGTVRVELDRLYVWQVRGMVGDGVTDYEAGWGIEIDDRIISVDPTVIQSKLTAGSGIYIDPITNVVSATNEIEIITTQTTYQELCDIVDSGKIPILKLDENAVGQTGNFAYEVLTADFRDSNRFYFGRIENQSWEGGVIYFNGHICYGDRPYYWSSYGRFIATTDMVHNYTAGSYVSIDNDVISVTGIDPNSYATHIEVDSKVVSAMNVVTGMIPEAQVQSDWTETDTTDPAYILHKPDEYILVAGDNIELTPVNDNIVISASGMVTEQELGTVSSEIVEMIPSAQVQSDWTETDTSDPSYIQNKPELAPVATSGSYNDLDDTPDLSVYTTEVDVHNIIASSVSGGDSFYAEVHVTPYSEIKAAYDAGYTIYAVYHAIGTSDKVYTLEYHVDEIGGGGAEFKFANIDEHYIQTAHCYEQPAGHSSTGWKIDTAIAIPAAQVQTDWNATYGMASILNKPDLSVYTTETEVQNMIASSVTDGPWYDMADMTAANTELWDTLSEHLQSGKSDNVIYTYNGQQYIGYTELSDSIIYINTFSASTAYNIVYTLWRWERGYAVMTWGFTTNAYYNKQTAGSGLQTTNVNNGTMSVKLGDGLYFDVNDAIAVTPASAEAIVIDYGQMTAANTALFDEVLDDLEDGKHVLFTQWNNTSNRDTAIGVATEWTDTEPYSITFKMQYYSGTYLNTDTVTWTRGSAAARSSSSARFNFQNAGDGLQTTSVSNGIMSVKLGNGLYFDADNAVAVSGGGGGSDVEITPVLSSGVKIAEYAVDGVSGELFAPQGGGSTYTAGDHIDISNDTISVTGITELVAGDNINITASGASAIISSTGGGGGDSGNIFEVIHGTTTFSDINTAFNEGKTLLFVHYPSSYDTYGTFTGTLVAKDSYTYVFGGFTDGYSASNTTTYVEYAISQWTGWSNTPRAQRNFNMQPDWNQTNSNSGDYIKNKPTIHTYTGSNGINITGDVVSLDSPVSLVPGNNIEISVSGVSAIISSTGGGGGSASLPISGVNGNYTARYGVDSALLDYNLPSVGGGEPEHSTNNIQPGFISISTSYDGDVTDESVYVGPEYIEFKENDGTYTTVDPSSIAKWNDAIVASQIASAAVVASLPANPLSNVLYLIPES